jgi:protein required for attachment to host cells
MSIWEEFKDISKKKLSKKVLKEIKKNCTALEIYGSEYCKGNIEELLLEL